MQCKCNTLDKVQSNVDYARRHQTTSSQTLLLSVPKADIISSDKVNFMKFKKEVYWCKVFHKMEKYILQALRTSFTGTNLYTGALVFKVSGMLLKGIFEFKPRERCLSEYEQLAILEQGRLPSPETERFCEHWVIVRIYIQAHSFQKHACKETKARLLRRNDSKATIRELMLNICAANMALI